MRFTFDPTLPDINDNYAAIDYRAQTTSGELHHPLPPPHSPWGVFQCSEQRRAVLRRRACVCVCVFGLVHRYKTQTHISWLRCVDGFICNISCHIKRAGRVCVCVFVHTSINVNVYDAYADIISFPSGTHTHTHCSRQTVHKYRPPPIRRKYIECTSYYVCVHTHTHARTY